jgi:hypothetical protein
MYTKTKLTTEQKDRLAIDYEDAMAQTADSYNAAHMRLIVTLNDLGYSVQSRAEAFRVAEKVLWG